ncbi:DUF3347 domain-containing protein [Pedobacter frigidisoli]|uniref:DUF3347 domain-containing protein n=1 Tax=Pedobacter frigidisoli TaxID=2530455 RepID=UPI00292EA818|nr:DUF3347 domain-containing protein [Pedobacter frigidisoli]
MKKIFGIAILATLLACNQSEKKSENLSDSTTKSASANHDVKVKDAQKDSILVQYFNLKNALVKSDSSKAQAAAKILEKSLAGYEGCEPTALIAGKIASKADLATQRKDFTTLSADIIALVKSSELEKGTVYVQHCPMANKGDGGDWLSSEKQIRNPYYGDEMLECGSVVEEIKTK